MQTGQWQEGGHFAALQAMLVTVSLCCIEKQTHLRTHLALVNTFLLPPLLTWPQAIPAEPCALSCPSPCRKEWSPVFSGVCVLVAIAPLEVLVNVNMAE